METNKRIKGTSVGILAGRGGRPERFTSLSGTIRRATVGVVHPITQLAETERAYTIPERRECKFRPLFRLVRMPSLRGLFSAGRSTPENTLLLRWHALFLTEWSVRLGAVRSVKHPKSNFCSFIMSLTDVVTYSSSTIKKIDRKYHTETFDETIHQF
ncbi:hypothetical protein TNCT_358801 [Trichonephila clavata]|uniref:Uncharacterized protein n=1 Tax=Trichonephila clavata TaxID=2740835 RepID=A0A8X6FJ61_TRICU|nr:hypothetical protein TNCT_358801 [Trichonephila clavata]